MPNSSGLNVQNLQKVFFPRTSNELHVLKNVNLTIEPGEFVAVIGNNGAGKSTLLNTIAGTFGRRCWAPRDEQRSGVPFTVGCPSISRSENGNGR